VLPLWLLDIVTEWQLLDIDSCRCATIILYLDEINLNMPSL